jgi:hypothetical protein
MSETEMGEALGFAGADDFLSADLTRYETLTVPGMAKPVRVRGLRSDEFTTLQSGLEKKGKGNYLAMIVQMGLIHADGRQVFPLEETHKVSSLPAHITSPIAAAIFRLSGLTKEQQQTLEDKSEGAGS